jgi:hypothetical protein
MTTPATPGTPTPKPTNTKGGLGCLAILAVIVWAVFLRGGSSGSATTDAPARPLVATVRPAVATLLELSGNGIKKSRPFTATGPWTLGYQFDCSSFGVSGNFIVTVGDTTGGIVDFAVNELAARGQDSTQEYDTGDLYLEMNSECTWSVRVTG